MQKKLMKRAFELAKKGEGYTSPNPCVGAVVAKNGKIIGEGWHKKAGGPHAEVTAIKQAQKKYSIKGADIYITLEPCCTQGKTAPCTDLIIQSGIKRVVFGMIDPISEVNGRGARILKTNGIAVEKFFKKDRSHSKLCREIRMMNQPFIKWAKTGLPYVILKAAISLDGKIATRTGKSKWITCARARKDARKERSIADAVLVGAGTVKSDNPELAACGNLRKKGLLRVIIDPKLSLSLNKKVFRDKNIFIACTDEAAQKNKRRLEKAGIAFQSFGSKRVSIKKLLQYLGKKSIQSIYVEGGSKVHGSFNDQALHDSLIIDKTIFYISPKIIGGVESLSSVGGKGVASLDKALELKEFEAEKIGACIKTWGIINYY